MPYGDYSFGPDTAQPLTGNYSRAPDYGGFATPEDLERSKLGIKDYQTPAAQSPYAGSISSSLPLFGGMLGFVQGFEGAFEYERQAKLLKKQAWYARERGFQTGIDIADEGAEIKGAMTAAFGKTGTLLEGSPLLALADTQTEIERNIALAIEQGRIESESLLWQARQAHRAANSSRWGGVAKLVGNWGSAIAGGGG